MHNYWTAKSVADTITGLPASLERELAILGNAPNWFEQLPREDRVIVETLIDRYNDETNYGAF